MQVMWNRLISVVEEQAMTLLRTAFSTSVREAGDLSAGVFDPQGRMLAQAVTGTPGHVNTMAEAVPISSRDPAPRCSRATPTSPTIPGRAPAISMTSPWSPPSFLDGETGRALRLHGACRRHRRPRLRRDGKSVYEEGIQIPIMKFAERGKVNRDLVHILRTNVREPNQVVGDFYSLAACNDVGHRRLVDMMQEFGLRRFDALGDFIFAPARRHRRAHRGAAAGERVEQPDHRWLR